jgi:hypothetical protein
VSTDLNCPICIDGEVVRREGQLEQSGESYLPTHVWGCMTCGWARYEPARHAPWRPAGAVAATGDADATSLRAA